MRRTGSSARRSPTPPACRCGKDDVSPRRDRVRRFSLGVVLDWFFFVFAGAASVWLAYLSFTETFHLGWAGIAMAVLFWLLLAYLVLPRLHRILPAVYVSDYFIGRTRTSDGRPAEH